MQQKYILTRYKGRRLIMQAMAGAAFGVGIVAVPSFADVPSTSIIVNTKADVVDPSDGLISLREAIIAVNESNTQSVIGFAASLGTDPVLTLDSALPPITNNNGVIFDTTVVGKVTLPQPLTLNNGQAVLMSGSELKSSITGSAESSVILKTLDADAGGNGLNSDSITGGGGFGSSAGDGADGLSSGDVKLTGDITLAKSATMLLAGDGGVGGAGGTGNPVVTFSDPAGGDGGFGGDGGDVTLIGNIIAKDDSYIALFAGNGAAGGNGGDGQTAPLGNLGGLGGFGAAGGNGGNVIVEGNLDITNGAVTAGAGNAGIGGNGGFGDSSVFEGGFGGDGDYGGDGGDVTITGKVNLTNSEFNLVGGDGAKGGVDGSGGAGGFAGDGGFGGIATIDGDVHADKSTFNLFGGDGGKDVNWSSNGDAGVGGDANIIGKVNANDSTFTLSGGVGGHTDYSDGGNAFIQGDVEANNSIFSLEPGIAGSGFSAGEGGDAFIDGKFTANGNSVLNLRGELSGRAYTTGDVILNGTSKLTFERTPELNLNGGTATTELGQNATLVAPLKFTYPGDNQLTVNHLKLNNSRLETPWNSLVNSFTVGQEFPILQYLGNETGKFGHIYSPLTFDVDYGSGTNDIIKLTLTGVDYTQVEGNANQRAMEGYLNKFVNTPDPLTPGSVVSLNQADLQFDLAQLTMLMSQNGATPLNAWIPDNLAAHNAQTYWTQRNFVNSIAANLRNTHHQRGGAAQFALNQSLNAGAQLASLRDAMNAPTNASLQKLGFNDGSAIPSSGIWANYNGAHTRVKADSGIGSHAWSSSTDGYTVGYTAGSEGFRWGAAVGHQENRLTFSDVNVTGKQDGYNGGLYASWQRKSTFLNAILGYGRYDNDAYGTSGDLHYRSKALSGSLELGKHAMQRKNSDLTPYVGINWTRIKNADATDTGTGLTLNSGSSNTYSTALGARYTNRMYRKDGSLKGGWEAGAAWLHQFGDTNFNVNVGYSAAVPGSFRAQTTPLDGDSLQVNLGAYGRIHNRVIGFAGYQGTFGSSQKINAVNAGVGYQF